MMPKMMIAANIEVAQLVNATMHASLRVEVTGGYAVIGGYAVTGESHLMQLFVTGL